MSYATNSEHEAPAKVPPAHRLMMTKYATPVFQSGPMTTRGKRDGAMVRGRERHQHAPPRRVRVAPEHVQSNSGSGRDPGLKRVEFKASNHLVFQLCADFCHDPRKSGDQTPPRAFWPDECQHHAHFFISECFSAERSAAFFDLSKFELNGRCATKNRHGDLYALIILVNTLNNARKGRKRSIDHAH